MSVTRVSMHPKNIDISYTAVQRKSWGVPAIAIYKKYREMTAKSLGGGGGEGRPMTVKCARSPNTTRNIQFAKSLVD